MTTPVLQGGSIRVTLPKKARKHLGLPLDKTIEELTIVFIDTDKGVLMSRLDAGNFVDSITADGLSSDE